MCTPYGTADTAVETPFKMGNLLCSHSQENRAAYNPRSKRMGLACLADGGGQYVYHCLLVL